MFFLVPPLAEVECTWVLGTPSRVYGLRPTLTYVHEVGNSLPFCFESEFPHFLGGADLSVLPLLVKGAEILL